HVVPVERAAELPLVEPVYPLTAGLSAKVLRRGVQSALALLPDLPEWLDGELMRRQSFPDLRTALERIHNPQDALDIDPKGASWRRLAYDELLAGQLALALVRARLRRSAGRPLAGDGAIEARIRASLPYSLTRSQEQALAEIHADL